MNDMWGEIVETQELLDMALLESKRRGAVMVAAEAAYYGAKARRAFELKEDGISASMIGIVIKGECCKEMSAYHAAQVEYDNAREAVLVYKKRLDVLREQMQREWTQAGSR